MLSSCTVNSGCCTHIDLCIYAHTHVPTQTVSGAEGPAGCSHPVPSLRSATMAASVVIVFAEPPSWRSHQDGHRHQCSSQLCGSQLLLLVLPGSPVLLFHRAFWKSVFNSICSSLVLCSIVWVIDTCCLPSHTLFSMLYGFALNVGSCFRMSPLHNISRVFGVCVSLCVFM